MSDKSKAHALLKRDGKRKAVELIEVPVPIRVHLEPLEWKGFILESMFDPRLVTQVIVYKGLLFGTQVPHKLDASFLNNTTTTMLNNYQYNLKLG